MSRLSYMVLSDPCSKIDRESQEVPCGTDCATQHASELAAEVQAKERLRAALTLSSDVAKTAETTRDTLRDVIVDLTNQVESSKGDFSSWPHSRIIIPRLLEPLETMPSDLSNITSVSELWAYASATIVSLRDRLAAECRAHAETHRVARARISALEARIAYQDAELEECIMHAGQTLPRTSGSMRISPTHSPGLPPSPPPMPISEVNALHRRKLADKLLLEKEVEQLTEQLEKARLEANPVDTRQVVSESVPRTLHQPPAGPSQPGRKKRDRQNSQPTDASSKRGSSRRPSGSPRRGSQPTSPGAPAVEPDPDRTIRPDTLRAVNTVAEEMAFMNREIAVLSAKIDDFHAEKEILMAQVQAESSQVQAQQEGVNVHPRPSARPTSRRSNRPNEVDPPVRHLDPPQASPPLPPPPEPGGPSIGAQIGPGQPLEDYDGSMSMDLATPLIPTFILPVAGPLTLPHTVDSNFRFTPSPVLPPASTEISPLDLSSDRPLPGVASPHNPPGVDTSWQLQPGEQAVQELMGIAATAKRRT
ncbi:hypothetical protein C8R45DRAFT_218576 [Mycena sanguinolenta]|nr:hypothetical protein C8R45DRAFT_218576 [Mycena sanguinolenta]